jgi:SPIRAL1-like protein
VAPAPAPADAGSGSGGVSSNAYAVGSNQNAGNFLTDRRTTRVLAHPGGRSSIVFG